MPRSATARLFLAIDPPAHMREALVAWARGALGPGRGGRSGAARPLRLLDAELLHLTLCFLGERPLAEVEQIAAVLGDSAREVGELSIGAPLWLPPRRPRVLAVEVHDPDDDLGGCTVAQRSARPGHRLGARGTPPPALSSPHHARAYARGRRAARALLPPTPALAFLPQEVVLYRSWLAPEGASYEALASATLVPV